MECRDFRRMISRELDGEAGSVDRELLDGHLAACRACREFRESSALAASMHRSMSDVSAPPGLIGAIMAGIEGREDARWFSGWIRFAVPATAAALVALGILAGAFLTEIAGSRSDGEAEMLGLAYLDEHPPGSVGCVLVDPAEEVDNEQ